jgi:hypothetical protein
MDAWSSYGGQGLQQRREDASWRGEMWCCAQAGSSNAKVDEVQYLTSASFTFACKFYASSDWLGPSEHLYFLQLALTIRLPSSPLKPERRTI